MKPSSPVPADNPQTGMRSRLLGRDILRLGATGLRTRPVRAILSALGIAIGIAAMISVVGISSSSQAHLNEELDQLGTNLLTVTAGTSILGEKGMMSSESVPKVQRIEAVESASSIATLPVPVYRSEFSDPDATGGITVMVADQNLLEVVSGEVASGVWLNPVTATYPAVVLGSKAAERLGTATPGARVFLGGSYFTVVGILAPVPLAPEVDSAALIGHDIATTHFDFAGHPSTVYERSKEDEVERVRSLLAATISPSSPDQVEVSRPSDALAARNAANQAFTSLLLGVGSIALLVGGIGVANTMIISVLERRREIGLRRALGGTRAHILVQFLVEALLLSALGGVAGSALGGIATFVVSIANGWPFSLSPVVVLIAVCATLLLGAIAGLYPASRAARTPPTAALNS